MNTIPKIASFLRSPKAVQQRQIFAQKAGNFRDFQPKRLNLKPPPFNVEVVPVNSLIIGLIAYWKLDSGSGTQTFDVNNNFPLSNILAGTFEAAKIGNGFRMAAPNLLTESGSNEFVVPNFSASFWLKINGFSVSGTPRILNKQEPGLDGFNIITNATGNLAANLSKDGVNTGLNPAGIMVAGTWYFIVLRYNTANSLGSLFWYDELGLISQTDNTGAYEAAGETFELQLGNSTAVAGYNITMDELGYWNRALTNVEINMLWNNGAGKAYPFN